MTAKILPTTRKINIIEKMKFAMTAFNVDNKTFKIYIIALAELIIMPIYPFCKV